jgi:hypothetical protein
MGDQNKRNSMGVVAGPAIWEAPAELLSEVEEIRAASVPDCRLLLRLCGQGMVSRQGVTEPARTTATVELGTVQSLVPSAIPFLP